MSYHKEVYSFLSSAMPTQTTSQYMKEPEASSVQITSKLLHKKIPLKK